METMQGYLTNLASQAPAPGGGSAAMVVGAAGCALVAMTARICAQSAKYEAVHPLAQALTAQADALREQFLRLRVEDEAAFEAVVAARGDKAAMQAALLAAAGAPLRGAKTALDALALAQRALDLRNPNLLSDVGCAAEFAHSALVACAYNVRINHKYLKDEARVAQQRGKLEAIEREGGALLSTVRAAVRERL